MTEISPLPFPERPELQAAFDRANALYNAMTPAEQARMRQRQRRSFVRAEIGFGSDADEAAYRAALARGDTEEMARLDAESKERIAAFVARFPEQDNA